MASTTLLPDPIAQAVVAECEFHIRPPSRLPRIDLASLWRARELLYFLIWRDVKVRYKQTILGVGWAVLQPLLTMIVFTYAFGRLAGIKSDGLPYPLFCFAALLPWTFFANGASQSANCLVGNANLITKIYLPRLVLPVASVLSGMVDFLLAFLVFLGMLVAYGYKPHVGMLLLPLPLALAMLSTLGVGFWLAALNVQFRDVRHTIPFLMQLWMAATPIVYSASLFGERGRLIYGLNPIAGVVESFRWAVFQTDYRVGPMIAVSALVSIVLFVTGAMYFRRMEQGFADIV